jgi:hypothetical protein
MKTTLTEKGFIEAPEKAVWLDVQGKLTIHGKDVLTEEKFIEYGRTTQQTLLSVMKDYEKEIQILKEELKQTKNQLMFMIEDLKVTQRISSVPPPTVNEKGSEILSEPLIRQRGRPKKSI